MGLRPTQGDESRSHTDRAAAGEVSAVPERGELMQILRYAQNDRLSRERSEESRSAFGVSRGKDQGEIPLPRLRDRNDSKESGFSAAC